MTMKLTLQKSAAALVAAGMLIPSLAFANEGFSVSANASTTATQRSCMQTATSVKADANIASLDSLFASIRTAFVARKNATIAAWGTADGSARVAALVSANTAFASSVKNAWKSFRTSRTSADATYKTSAKACGIEKAANEAKKDEKKKDDSKNAGIGSKFHLNLGLFRH